MVNHDAKWMRQAIKQAGQSESEDSRPHPKVGVVVVKNGRILFAGHRGQFGPGDHAEYGVLEKALDNVLVADATVYTTLEPCTTRRHPKVPCADRLVEHKVKRVVVGMLDPNPLITGRGVLRLQAAGIQVDYFPERWYKQVAEQNRAFSRAVGSPEPTPSPSTTTKHILHVDAALGLVAVASRDDKSAILAPEEFYECAEREIALTGVSAARTFDIHVSVLRAALAHNKKVLVLILDPTSPDVRLLSKREGRPIATDIRSTLTIARREGFLGHPGFELRIAKRLPPFTAIMLDGNISGSGTPEDDAAYLRVQPGTLWRSQHEGIVFQFKRSGNQSMGFDYFSGDLREQWRKARRVHG